MRLIAIGATERIATFEIGGASDTFLRFHSRQLIPSRYVDSYIVTLVSNGIDAHTTIENSDVGWPPSQFFAELAATWHSEKLHLEWYAMEGGLQLEASADALAHTITATLSRDVGPDRWQAVGHCQLEAGQLEAMAFRAKAFFGA